MKEIGHLIGCKEITVPLCAPFLAPLTEMIVLFVFYEVFNDQLQVKYNFPAHVSIPARDLISKVSFDLMHFILFIL